MAAASVLTCFCGENTNIDYNYCPHCGAELADDERSIITYYFNRGFEYKTIVLFLLKKHGMKMSERTLRYRLSEYGLRRKLPVYDEIEVRRRIACELEGPGCVGGYRAVWHTLKMEGITVPRSEVESIVRELDPEGCDIRKRQRLRRRKYRVPGPNFCWHIDGYDKLKPYGLPIHGCIDGWSRKILWLRVERSNNCPEVTASHFLKCIEEYGGCPVKVRTDCGTENGTIAAMQCELRQTAEAHIYGTSPSNQRIEGWWSFYRRNRSTWWINYFKDLVDNQQFNPDNDLEKECIWYCYSGVIQSDLDFIKEHWNTHRIRNSRHDTVSGRPDELYFLPENNGGEDGLLQPVSAEQLFRLKENLQVQEEPNMYHEYFEHISNNGQFLQPGDWKEAEQLYDALLSVAKG